MDKLNEQFLKVEEGKKNFADSVAQMETDFDEKMGEIVTDLGDAIQEMDLQDTTYKIGQNNVQGLIDGTADPSLRQALVDEYIAMAKAALDAYKQTVGQHSPSKEFAKAGSYDVQGLIEGAEAKKAELSATYADLAMTAFAGYKAAAAQGMADLSKIAASLKDLDSYFDVKSSVGDLKYQLWERTEGQYATDVQKYAKKLEMLTEQQEDQATVVEAAEAAYEAVVEQYGLASEESYNYQKTLLEEKLAYQDLLDMIQAVTDAKRDASISQIKLKIQAESATSGSQGFSAAYEEATQRMLTAQATHLPSTLDVPSQSGALERQLEDITAGVVNAISSIAQDRGSGVERVRVVTVDGKVLAEAAFDDLVNYGDANGTPILTPQR